MKNSKCFKVGLSVLSIAAVLLSILGVGLFAVAAEDQWTIDTTFEGVSDAAATGWSAIWQAALSIDSQKAHSGTNSLKASATEAWDSPQLNIYPVIKAGGAGEYTIRLWRYAETAGNNQIRIRTNGSTVSFANENDGNYITGEAVIAANTWTEYAFTVNVTAEDIAAESANWALCPANSVNNYTMWIDDLAIVKNKLTYRYDFEESTEVPGWTKFGGDLQMEIDTAVAHSGSHSLKTYNRSFAWTSPTKDILPFIRGNGAATYTLTAWVRSDTDAPYHSYVLRINGVTKNEENPSFVSERFEEGGNQNCGLAVQTPLVKDTWTKCKMTFVVTAEDLAKGTSWEPTVCDIPESANIWIDDVSLIKEEDDSDYEYDGGNLIPEADSTLEGFTDLCDSGWFGFIGGVNGSVELDTAHGADGSSQSVVMRNRSGGEWYSPAYDIYPLVKKAGAGMYTLRVQYSLIKDGLTADVQPQSRFRIRSDGAQDANSFIVNDYGNYGYTLGDYWFDQDSGGWATLEWTWEVKESDLEGDHRWIFCGDGRVEYQLAFDNLSLTKYLTPDFYITYEAGSEAAAAATVLNGRKALLNAHISDKFADKTVVWTVQSGEAKIEPAEELSAEEQKTAALQSVYVTATKGTTVVVRAALAADPETYADFTFTVNPNAAALRTLVGKAGSMEGDYSAAAAKKLSDTLAAAEALLDQDEFTQEEIDAMIAALQAAMDEAEASIGSESSDDNAGSDSDAGSGDNTVSDGGTDSEDNSQNPDTGETVSVTAFVLLALSAAFSLAVLFVSRKRSVQW